jgi:1,4-alpha-glucan branching enzyme
MSGLQNKVNAAQQDESNFVAEGSMHLAGLARTWQECYRRLIHDFTEVYGEDVVGALRSLEERGAVELMTCAATHGYLPLLGEDGAVRAQIRVAVETHKRRFDTAPRGFWLPECAYRPSDEWSYPIDGWGLPKTRPGLEEFLANEDIRYFVVDSHLVQGGPPVTDYPEKFGELEVEAVAETSVTKTRPKGVIRSPYNVYYAEPQGGDEPRVAFFTRDPKTGVQVWSGTAGYPGHGDYLEFHKKRFPGGHRYWRVTDRNGGLDTKLEYVPEEAEKRVLEHAENFLGLVADTLRQPGSDLVTAPYDAELYGHWWFEGPRWLMHVLKLAHDHSSIEPMTPMGLLEEREPVDVVPLPEGSWGLGGEHDVWFNKDTRWTWVRIYDAETKMRSLIDATCGREDADLDRLLQQMGRELLLLESSDWQFNMATWNARDYAEKRLEEHYDAFKRLHEIACDYVGRGELPRESDEILKVFEARDGPFETVRPEWWQ